MLFPWRLLFVVFLSVLENFYRVLFTVKLFHKQFSNFIQQNAIISVQLSIKLWKTGCETGVKQSSISTLLKVSTCHLVLMVRTSWTMK